jgi:cytochrome c oxidase assembly protein subunit 15
MPRRLTLFQRLALWTTAITYFLILVGGLVRASGAGLGCPDWPRCFGSWIPPASVDQLPPGFDPSQFNATLMWTEYLNRLLGVAVGLLIFATLVVAFRRHRDSPRIVWPTFAAFLLVGFQGWLGGVVVQQELAPWLVTVHLVVALIIVSLLLYAAMAAFFPAVPRAVPASRRVLFFAGAALIAVTFVQVAVGAQVRGRVDELLMQGAPRVGILANVGNVDLWHRELALVVLLLSALVAALVWRRHGEERRLVQAVWVVVLLVLTQLAVGVSMAYISLTPPAQVAHLTASSLILGAETVVLLLARWLPAPEQRFG